MLEIKSISQFNALKSSSSLLIIDFYATWCGPCKAISPVFAKLSTPHASSSSIVFAQVDVDKAKDVAQQCGISAMPTFQFYRGGKIIDEVKGADVQQLTTKVGYYIGEVGKPARNTSSSSNTQGSGSGSGSGAGEKKVESLRSLIDVEEGRLVNATLLSSVRNIASPPPAGYSVASTSTPKVLIYIPFTSPVIPTSITIRIAASKPPSSTDMQSAPSRLTIGSNVPVTFRKIEDKKTGQVSETNDLDMEESLKIAEADQSFNVFSDEFVDGKVELKLKGSKFGKGVKSLLVRVERNLSGEEKTVTKIGEMDVLGIRA
ncbi:uncharacterized protein RSE6_01841 [Rhynchosporium secalis]|uniref:Thioredoxin-like protein n=1 Tax=Rhynchosporium secalis TaxID=38038 RepID=A0A1E1M0F6_RHYSE|nr:uncharacterized protein RSE6_01841 [Rhynchosporium secalis]